MQSAKENVKNVTEEDVVVLLGGTMDTWGNEVTDGLSWLKHCVRENSQKNIIQMYVQHRFD
jgi:hypothetical protein